jgi:hypothetical protein
MAGGPRVCVDKGRARRREDTGTPEAAPNHQRFFSYPTTLSSEPRLRPVL